MDGFKRTCTPVNVQATLVQLTAMSIANAFHDHAPATQEVIVCGGGAHNPLLMQALARTLTSCNVKSTAELGINPDAMEAMAFAWLARCRLEGIAGNLPSVTGASGPVLLGGIYAPRPQR
jgi:anhydro-N-acetylmuramic acid kinase